MSALVSSRVSDLINPSFENTIGYHAENITQAKPNSTSILMILSHIKGHLLFLALPFGLPLAITLHRICTSLTTHRTEQKNQDATRMNHLSFLAVILLFSLIIAVCIFTNTPRAHLRYYNFVLPLLYITTAGALCTREWMYHRTVKVVISVAIFGIATYTLFFNYGEYKPNFIDSPEIRGLHYSPPLFMGLGTLMLASLFAWNLASKFGCKLYLYVTLPLFAVVASHYVSSEQRTRMKPQISDNAGILTKRYLTEEELSRTVVVATDRYSISNTLFHIDNIETESWQNESGAPIDISQFPVGSEWALVIGEYELLTKNLQITRFNGFDLIRLAKQQTLDFKKNSWPELVRSSKGLSNAESWGTWSLVKSVVIDFKKPLPKEFALQLEAKAFKPKVTGPFKVIVGNYETAFHLKKSLTSQTLHLKNPNRSSQLTFHISAPASPSQFNLRSNDTRELGIGFSKIRIISTQTEE